MYISDLTMRALVTMPRNAAFLITILNSRLWLTGRSDLLRNQASSSVPLTRRKWSEGRK